MTNILTSDESNKKESFTRIERAGLFASVNKVLNLQVGHFPASQALVQATVYAVDKCYTQESSFLRSGLCENLINTMLRHGNKPGMRMQFVVAIGRLSSGNRFMQEKLVALNVLVHLVQTIADSCGSDPGLLKLTCFAVGTLVARFHTAQTKFATLGGCRAICQALRVTQDLSALTYILRTMAALSLQNSYVQDFFELESGVELMQAKKREIAALSERSESFEMKSKLNLLLLTCQYALDAVLVPGGRAGSDESAIATSTVSSVVGGAETTLSAYTRMVMARAERSAREAVAAADRRADNGAADEAREDGEERESIEPF
jgi:hypothetical protein